MKYFAPFAVWALLALIAMALPASADTTFTTLGTTGGPAPRLERSQPANLLSVDGELTLIDAGDGVTGRLAAKGIHVLAVDNLVISHLHFDHTGGILALLGLRFQNYPQAPLQIYGPPGTEATVTGILQGMAPSMRAAYGVPNEAPIETEKLVVAHDIRGGDVFELGAVTVTAVENTHYSFEPGSELAKKFQSLSFRFDTPDRSIVFTGDTGPSDAVTELARGADLLVSELMDFDAVLGEIKNSRPDIPDGQLREIETHLAAHHLQTHQVAEMAKAAGVKKLVLTHLVSRAEISEEDIARWEAEIAEGFDGEITIAHDLQEF